MKESLQLYQCSRNKFELREHLRTKRSKLSSSFVWMKSEQISYSLIKELSLKLKKSDRIALYSPIAGEVDTRLIDFEIRKLNKSVYYPKIIGERMYFVKTNSLDDLSLGHFGIREPAGEKYISISNLDIFIIPAIAIGLDGSRLGFGKGFYDKELEDVPRRKMFSAIFDFQLVDKEFREEHDIKVDKVFTEKRVITIN